MFPFDQSALPQLTTRRAFIGVDFQNDFTASDGALPIDEPVGYAQRAAELAAAFRSKGEVIWVQSRFEGSRAVDDEHIIVTDAAPTQALRVPAPRSARLSRLRVSASAEGPVEAAGPVDSEAFLSHDEPLCLKDSTPSACEWTPEIRDSMGKGDLSFTKTHYSAFKATQLLHILRAKMVMEVFICGSLTNVGVYATAMDAAGHGLSINIVEDCCGFRSEARQRQAVKSLIEFTGCEVASSKEVLETIQPAALATKASEPPRKPVAEESRKEASRNSKSPDIVRPMTGLRLESHSPNPRGPIVASPAVGEDNSQPKLREAAGSGLASASASESILKHEKGDQEGAPNPSDQTQGKCRQTPVDSSTSGLPKDDMAQADHDSDNDEGLPLQKGLCEGDTDIIDGLLPKELEEGIFDKLRDEIPWKRMSHQGGDVPRLVAVQGQVADDGSIPVYRHPSDESLPLSSFSPTVLAIKAATEKQLGHTLNHALIQFYRDGKDYISEHSDKTLDIVKGSYIANVSLGAERTMVLRTKRLGKDPSRTGPPPSEGSKRKTQRARLSHNSLCRMGLLTNMKWLHAIRQDKRAERDKSAAEVAFSGGRISLTFRHIGTFLDRDETTIWGQGATGKTREDAHAIINGTGPEAIEMLKAFGAENHSSTFDWDTSYGKGFDVLHMSNSPRLFASQDPVVNMRIALMLAELGINYARGSMGSGPSRKGEEPKADVLPVKFVDSDTSKSVVKGDVAIMLYLDMVYGRVKRGTYMEDPAMLAKEYTRFQEALDFSRAMRHLQTDTTNDKVDLKALRHGLAVWDGYVSEAGCKFLVGTTPSLPDFVIWSVLHTMVESHGLDLFDDGLGALRKYYETYMERDSVKKVLGKASKAERT